MARIQVKRGLYANLPASALLAGEMLFSTDRGSMHVAIDATTKLGIVPALDELVTMPVIDPAADLLLMEDASQTGRKAKKITFADFKTALNIPNGSSDQATAAYNGGTSGSLFGTDATDGVLRLSSALKVTKGSGGAYGTLDVDVIDCGTF